MTTTRSRDQLRADAIALMTEAARQRTPKGEPYDMADFIAHVLAATAANLGGCDLLLEGRPGSWEADYVRELVDGTMSDDPTVWQQYRTEPITVTLNVAELIEDGTHHPGLTGLEDAVDACYDRSAPTDEGCPTAEERAEMEARADELDEHYRDAYKLYSQLFAAAVRANAAAMNLTVPVNVVVDADPLSSWWDTDALHNADGAQDPLTGDLWNRAHDATRLPNVHVRHGDPRSTASEQGDAA